MIEVYAEGRPAPQGSLTKGRGGSLRHSSRYLAAWREEIARTTRDHMGARGPLLGPVRVRLVFELRRPLRHYRGRERGRGLAAPAIGAYPRTPDLDKLIRSTLDALVLGGMIGDDAQVIDLEARKEYSSGQGAHIRVDEVLP
jgi:Holliday junction resolvase RusA-like endonuclease